MESKDSKPTNEDVINKLKESGEDGAVSFLFDHYSLDESEKPPMNCFRASFKRLKQKHKLDHLTVRFMKQIQDNIWVWPELDDLSLVPYSDKLKFFSALIWLDVADINLLIKFYLLIFLIYKLCK